VPSFFPLPPSLSPHSPTSLTHLQPKELRKEIESQAQLSQQHRSHADAMPSILPSGVVPSLYVSTEQLNYNRGSTSGLPEETNGTGDSRKNDRDRSTLSTGSSLRVHSSRVIDSRQNLDANQSN